MPANYDLYNTATMLKAIELMPPINTFLSDTFCEPGDNCDDNRAIYDYRKGSTMGLAPFIVPGTGGTPISREGSEMRFIEFADLCPQLNLGIDDVSVRMFGEPIMGSMTPDQRAKRILARDLVYLRTLNQNTRNWMLREVLLTGKLEIRRMTQQGMEKKPTLIADFGFENNYVPDTKWNQAGARIMYDMENVNEMLAENLGDLDILVMHPGVFQCMLENDKFMKTMDMKNVDMGEIKSKYRGQGLRFRGVNSDGVEFYTLSGRFQNYNGQMEEHIPAGTIIAGSHQKKALTFKHGPITKVVGQGEDSKMNFYVKKEVPFRVGDDKSDTLGTMLKSRPTVMPINVGGWAVMKVL